jgi:hypothetical protein
VILLKNSNEWNLSLVKEGSLKKREKEKKRKREKENKGARIEKQKR